MTPGDLEKRARSLAREKRTRARHSARAKARGHTTAEETVQLIMRMMAACEWVHGITVMDLSRRIGMAEATITRHAAEASRRLRAAATDREIAEVLRTTVQQLMADARKHGEYRTALYGAHILADLCGATRAEGGDELEQASDEELLAAAERAGGCD